VVIVDDSEKCQRGDGVVKNNRRPANNTSLLDPYNLAPSPFINY
jgi:hypothetical protein